MFLGFQKTEVKIIKIIGKNMGLKYANVSVKKKKVTSGTHNYATNLGKHLLRDTVEYYPLADQNSKNKNQVLINMECDTLAKSLNKFLKKHDLKTRNSTTVQAYQLVFSIPKTLKNDPDTIEKFKNEVLNFVNTDPKFKDNCLLLVYHGDEVQPHIQGVFVPRTYDNTLNFKRFLGGLDGGLKIHKLHDDFHDAVGKKLGLARGDGTHTTGLDHKRYLKAVGELEQPVELPDQVATEKTAVMPWNRISQLEKQVEDLQDSNKKLRKGIDKTLFYSNQNSELKKTNASLRKIKKKYEEQQMKLSNERKELLRQIPCEFVLEKLGYEVKSEGNTYRCKTEDLNIVINSENKFTENKSMVQGFGAISLLVDVFKMKFVEAIKFLGNEYGSEATALTALADRKSTVALVKNNVEKIAKEIPKPVEKNIANVINYLTNIRKIKTEVVQELISKKLLFADKNNNCVFVNDKNTFAFQRGTYEKKRFVSVVGEPDFLKYEFGKSTDTYLFESAIDALSFRSMYPEKDGKYIVLSGSMLINRVHEVLDQNSKLYLCFDNDEQGQKFCDKITSEVVNEVVIIKPQSKDFNEDLINGNGTTKPSPTVSIGNSENPTGFIGKTKEINSNPTNRDRKNRI